MARRTKQEAMATRDSLLDAAEQLFQRQGVSRTTLAQIAAAAGVTRGAVYWHFKDKADLFEAMLARVRLPIEQALIELQPTLAPSGAAAGRGRATTAASTATQSALALLRRRMLTVLRLVAEDEHARRVFEIAILKTEFAEELDVARERRLRARDGYIAQMEGLLRAAQRGGELPRRLPARTLALSLYALLDGLLVNWLFDPRGFALVTVGAQAIDAFLRGIAAQPAVQSDSAG